MAKYVSVPALSVISCARKLANARLTTVENDARPASSSPGASGTSAALEPAAATPAAIAVAAGADPGEQDEDRGDDADDRGQAEHHAQPVHDRGEQDGDEDADHDELSFLGLRDARAAGVTRGFPRPEHANRAPPWAAA